jgi:hypothetical protein
MLGWEFSFHYFKIPAGHVLSTTSKKSGPKGRGFALPLRGFAYSFPLAIDDAGVRCQEKIKKLKPETSSTRKASGRLICCG